MRKSHDSGMMMFHIPEEPDVLETVGAITLRHSHLDHILRMTIKTLGDVTIQQALDATTFEGSEALRRRIRKLAKQKLGEGEALIQLQALLERCRRVTVRRNELVHNIWARELDGDPKVRNPNHTWEPVPTIDELNALSNELHSLTDELNKARLDGFLSEAIALSRRILGRC